MPARDRLQQGYWNGNAKSDSNPGGMGKGGHRVNLPAALVDVGDVAKQVGDDAAIAASAASQSGAWVLEGNPGSVIRMSDTQFAIKGVNRTSIYVNKPNPRALRLIQSKMGSRLLTNNQVLNQSPFAMTGASALDLSMPNPFGVGNKASQLNETSGGTLHNAEIAYPSYVADEYLILSAGLKANSRYRGQIGLGQAGWSNSLTITFDLNAGTASAVSATGVATGAAGGIFALGNGYYRVWVAGKLSTSAGAATARLAVADNAGQLSYSGTAGSGYQVWDVAFHKLKTSPAADNDFMFVKSAVWDITSNSTIVTVLNGYLGANFGAYATVDTDGLYFGQDPNNAPRGGSAAAKMYAYQNLGGVCSYWFNR